VGIKWEWESRGDLRYLAKRNRSFEPCFFVFEVSDLGEVQLSQVRLPFHFPTATLFFPTFKDQLCAERTNGHTNLFPRLARHTYLPLALSLRIQRNAPEQASGGSPSANPGRSQIPRFPRPRGRAPRDLYRHSSPRPRLPESCGGFLTRCCRMGQKLSDSTDLLSVFVLPHSYSFSGRGGKKESFEFD
jgi:hypothetical protein